ncbi:MAG: RecX family transcriptional regulator [Anaerolineales bacterium]
MKITALRLQKHNPNRVNVYLDGEFAFGLSRIVAAWLRVGDELSAEKITALQAEDGIEVAHQRALRLLESRPRTRQEITQNLKNHDTPPQVIEAVLERLERSGLLNDAAFARAWVENRTDFRPRGSALLRQELRQRGVPQKTIETVLTEIQPQEATLAYRAGQQRLNRYAALPWPEFRRKMGAYLMRRGFPYEIVQQALRQLWNDLPHPLETDPPNEEPQP